MERTIRTILRVKVKMEGKKFLKKDEIDTIVGGKIVRFLIENK